MVEAKVIKYLNFVKDYISFKKQLMTNSRSFTLRWQDRYLCLDDKTTATGFDAHYIYHPAWAARIIAQTRPDVHLDISSSLHFCTMISAFIPVKFFDYRPADIHLSGLTTETTDLLALPFADRSIQSLSCMHVVEHVGLGRYGDSLDPDGDLKAIAELQRVMAPGGFLLLVVPIGGIPKIMFNAHRIYSYEQVTSLFFGFELLEFSLVPDNPIDGGLIVNANESIADAQVYGCGCFLYKKK